jgi:DNA-directed RNA polymerase subunit H (RpoH/RPB5)
MEILESFLLKRNSKLISKISDLEFICEGSVTKIVFTEKAKIPLDGEVHVCSGVLRGAFKGRLDLFSIDEWKRIPTILNSRLQPFEFKFLTDEEALSILKEFNVTADRLPGICRDDMLVRIFGVPIGTVMRIRRLYVDGRQSLEFRAVKDQTIE